MKRLSTIHKRLTTNALIVIAGTIQAFFWSSLIPLWQFPDEQAHFAQVQNFVELGHSPDDKDDLSREIYETQAIMGTLRDERGNNLYTYHPEYNLPYSQTTTGIHEAYIKSLPRTARTEYVKRESPRYPPLFYHLVGTGYRLTYTQDIITRVFATRLVSVILFALIIYISLQAARQLFPKSPALQAVIASAVAFHPMLVFNSAGINNDTLLILITTAVTYYLLKGIRQQNLIKYTPHLIFLTFAGILTKQLYFGIIPTIIMVITAHIIYRYRKQHLLLALVAISFLVAIALFPAWSQWFNQFGFWAPFWPTVTPQSPGFHFSFTSLFLTRLQQLYRETFVWYWGVYKWLGLTLPLIVIRLIKITMIFSLIGWAKYGFNKVTHKTITTVDKQLVVLIGANLIYISLIVVWDIYLTRSMGFGHGLQGRYFFPLIFSQMTLYIFGLWQLIHSHRWGMIASVGAILLLQWIAVFTVLNSYYNLSSFHTFIIQASQYKPVYAKGVGLITIIVATITVQVYLLYAVLFRKLKS